MYILYMYVHVQHKDTTTHLPIPPLPRKVLPLVSTYHSLILQVTFVTYKDHRHLQKKMFVKNIYTGM